MKRHAVGDWCLLGPDETVCGLVRQHGEPDSPRPRAGVLLHRVQDDETNIGRAATTYIWGNGQLVDAWPAAPNANEYSQARTSNVETLLIGGGARLLNAAAGCDEEAPAYLPKGQQAVLPGSGTREASSQSSRKTAPG